MSSNSDLPPARTMALTAGLAALIAAIIVLVCAALALVGALLSQEGVTDTAQLTSPAFIFGAIIAGSIVIALLLSAIINRALLRPLRHMTLAVEHLADGDFAYRLPEEGALRLREVDEFARGFNVAAAELEGTEMMRAGFIGDFSHEFRTPINSLSGFAQILRDDDLEADERREYADIIVEEATRLAGLSERILLLSKVEAATILPHAEDVDVAEQLRRCALVLETKLESADVRLDLSLDDAHVRGNADYLMQLWMNLLDNAIKFSPAGSRVSVALYGGRAREEGRTGGSDSIAAWISDEGAGMDTDTKRHVFDRFYQGDSSHSAKGSGLGLSLCKRIVELHGGTIEVQSAPGKGSVFEVRLPRAVEESASGQ